MKRKLTMDYTSRSWGLGIEVGFPSRSERFFLGTKLRTHFSVTVYLGPFTVNWSKEPTIVEFEFESDKARELRETLEKGAML